MEEPENRTINHDFIRPIEGWRPIEDHQLVFRKELLGGLLTELPRGGCAQEVEITAKSWPRVSRWSQRDRNRFRATSVACLAQQRQVTAATPTQFEPA